MEHIATKHQPTPFGADNRQFQGFSRTFAEVGEYFILSPSILGSKAGADRIVVLADGVVAEQGSPSALYAKNGLYTHMANLQTKAQNWTI